MEGRAWVNTSDQEDLGKMGLSAIRGKYCGLWPLSVNEEHFHFPHPTLASPGCGARDSIAGSSEDLMVRGFFGQTSICLSTGGPWPFMTNAWRTSLLSSVPRSYAAPDLLKLRTCQFHPSTCWRVLCMN
jgi:hypothetical protein